MLCIGFDLIASVVLVQIALHCKSLILDLTQILLAIEIKFHLDPMKDKLLVLTSSKAS